MKLIYRGVTYDYDPTQPRISDIDERARHFYERKPLTYRGNEYWLEPGAQELYQPRGSYELIYRGSRYAVHPTGEQPVKAKRTIADLASTHRVNLQRNLQHRIEVARQNGDQALLALLEAEQRQLV